MRLWVSGIALAVYGVVVLFVLLWPTPVDRGYERSIHRLLAEFHERGLPAWFGYRELEFTSNIALFVPLAFFLAVALPRGRAWVALASLTGFSIVVEVTQGLLIRDRFGSALDVVANSIGALVGAAFGWLVVELIHRRDARVVARALWQHEHDRLTP